jgi:uncharacterized protein YecA (UPF0149 family)
MNKQNTKSKSAIAFTGGTIKRKHQQGRNDLCICGSGKKVKFCCLDEVENKYLARDNKKK